MYKRYRCKTCGYEKIAKNKKSISMHFLSKHNQKRAMEDRDYTVEEVEEAELEAERQEADIGKTKCDICGKMVNPDKMSYHKSRMHKIRGKKYVYPSRKKNKKENIPVIDVAGKDACITLPVILRIPIGPVNVSRQ